MRRSITALSVAAAVSIGMTNTTFASLPTVDKKCILINQDMPTYQNFFNNDDCKSFIYDLNENFNVFLSDIFLKNCINFIECNVWIPGCSKPEENESVPSEPEAESPETSIPETIEPDIESPETSIPEASESDIESPETTIPDTTAPENYPAEEETPETTIPESSSPESDSTESEETIITETNSDIHPYIYRIVELVNEERAKAGLSDVTLDISASQAAHIRAKETVQLFSHTRPDGRSCFTALTEQGINYRTAGENIAYGQRSPEEVMAGWMNSSGHRANILGETFTKIGVGYYQTNGVNYWTQLFFS